MQLYDTMEAYACAGGECVAALGMFDGVHMGHAALISEAVRQARALGVSAVVVTFKQNPVSGCALSVRRATYSRSMKGSRR